MFRTICLILSSSFALAACSEDGRMEDEGSGNGSGTFTAGTTGDTGTTTADTTGSGTTTVTSSTTTGTTTGEDSATESGSDTGDDCGVVMVNPVAIPPNVMLVLDKSGSMVSNSWDGDADPNTPDVTRWNSLFNVVEFITTEFDEQVNFGASLFPSIDAVQTYTAAACVTNAEPEVPVATMNGAAILAGIPGAEEVDGVKGATPATAGMVTAINHLATLDPTVARHIILVTDGAANCSASAADNTTRFESYDEALPTTVAAALADQAISTFVVGIDIVDEITGVGQDGAPEVNTFEKLNAVAEAGGKARAGDEKFYNAANEIDLQAALNEIAGAVISCTVPLEPPPKPDQVDFVKIWINGVEVPEIMDCDTENGWMFNPTLMPYTEIVLCGTACDDLKAVDGALDGEYGCPQPE